MSELWERIKQKSKTALEEGAIFQMNVVRSYCEENGIQYILYIRQRTETPQPEKPINYVNSPSSNPFLPPYNPSQVIDWNIDERYCLLLNKYRVLKNHLLVVTKQFEDQTLPLVLDDFRVFHHVLRDCVKGYGIYNCGQASGSSQPHRHMQVIPQKNIPNGFFDIVDKACEGVTTSFRCDRFFFEHIIFPISEDDTEEKVFSYYTDSLEQVIISKNIPMCHSLVFTLKWMMVVPRSTDDIEHIPINSIAFGGGFYLPREQLLEKLKEIGLMNILVRSGYSLEN